MTVLSGQPLSLEKQKQLAVNITHVLSLYGSIVDSYIIVSPIQTVVGLC